MNLSFKKLSLPAIAAAFGLVLFNCGPVNNEDAFGGSLSYGYMSSSSSQPGNSSAGGSSQVQSSSAMSSSSIVIIIDDPCGDGKKEYAITDVDGILWLMEDLACDSKTRYTWSGAIMACKNGWSLPNNAAWKGFQKKWEENKNFFSATVTAPMWTATEDRDAANYAYVWRVSGDSLKAEGSDEWAKKTDEYAVRCVKGITQEKPDELFPDTFRDNADGKRYKVKDIGGKLWFMEDLARNSTTRYKWEDAIKACPVGWNMPNNAAWKDLQNAWAENSASFSSTITAAMWSATADRDAIDYGYVWRVLGASLNPEGNGDWGKKSDLYAVRCVKNATQTDSDDLFPNSFRDNNDGRRYKIRKTDNEGTLWLMEDLARDGVPRYTWDQANTRCPSGWYLPNNAAWGKLKDTWANDVRDEFLLTISGNMWSATTSDDLPTAFAFTVKLSGDSLIIENPKPSTPYTDPTSIGYMLHSYPVRCFKPSLIGDY